MEISEDALDRSIGQLAQEGSFPPEVNPKSKELIRATSSIFTSLVMLPADRVIAKKIVGQTITKETLHEIAKKPFLGAAPRLMNTFMGSCLIFGGSAVFHGQLQQKYPMAPLLTSAMALAGGTVLDRVITTPLGTLGLRMQTQDKTFFTTLQEIISSNRPLRSLYAGTPALLIRDLLYLPVCIPMAEKLRSSFSNNTASSLTPLFQSTLAFFVSGTAASTLSYPFQYIGIMQKNYPLTAKQVFAKTLKESGCFGFYRGFKMAIGRMGLYNCLFGSAISIGERLTNRFC